MKKNSKSPKNRFFVLSGLELRLAEIARAKKSLYHFVKMAWKTVVRNHSFKDCWHIRVLCDHLQAVTEGKITKLLINIPPRHTKSLIISVFWPAWVWAQNPTVQWLFGSRTQLISLRDNRKCRELMQSKWYQQRFNVAFLSDEEAAKQKPELAEECMVHDAVASIEALKHASHNDFSFVGDQNMKSFYANSQGGHRIATSAGSQGTGLDADVLVIDDLHGINDTEDRINKDVEWCEDTFWSRGNTEDAPRVVIGQRVRGNDISGHIIGGQYGDDWTEIVLPMEFVPERKCKTGLKNHPDGYVVEINGRKILLPDGFEDPRIEAGEILAPMIRGEKYAADMRERKPGSHARLNQQNPSPAEGGTFKKRWLQTRYDEIKLEEVTYWGTSCDTPFRKGKNTDYYVHLLVAKVGQRYLPVAQERGRKSYDEMELAYENFLTKWEKILGYGRIKKNLVEGKASGDALIAKFKDKFPGVVAFEPGSDSKELRFELASPTFRAGNVQLPAVGAIITFEGRVIAVIDTTFVQEWLDEVTTVPHADNDDQADAITQFILDDQDPRKREQEKMPNVALIGAKKKARTSHKPRGLQGIPRLR